MTTLAVVNTRYTGDRKIFCIVLKIPFIPLFFGFLIGGLNIPDIPGSKIAGSVANVTPLGTTGTDPVENILSTAILSSVTFKETVSRSLSAATSVTRGSLTAVATLGLKILSATIYCGKLLVVF